MHMSNICMQLWGDVSVLSQLCLLFFWVFFLNSLNNLNYKILKTKEKEVFQT